ncbi:DUF3379 domain-containing protein [Vibrio sp.]|nr:DUF3379 domain-containing protein [Vibrio sp.]
MDELEFRKQILSDPKYRDADIEQAIKDSHTNKKLSDDALDIDKRISQAMNVDVPDDLADKILFSHNAQQSAETNNVIRPSFTKRAMSVAASVAFVVGLLAGQLNWGNVVVTPAHASIAEEAVKHVKHEAAFTSKMNEGASIQQVNSKMSPFGHSVKGSFPYSISYLNHCGFGGEHAVHMIFEGKKGKVNMFLTGMNADKPENFIEEGMSGAIVPIDDRSLIFVGEEGENMDEIKAQVLNAMSIHI